LPEVTVPAFWLPAETLLLSIPPSTYSKSSDSLSLVGKGNLPLLWPMKVFDLA
jgi:hypothetical protein